MVMRLLLPDDVWRTRGRLSKSPLQSWNIQVLVICKLRAYSILSMSLVC
jgi:hypothetical protein